jgi:hypothetical protein
VLPKVKKESSEVAEKLRAGKQAEETTVKIR